MYRMDISSIRTHITLLKLKLRTNSSSKEMEELKDEMENAAPTRRKLYMRIRRPRIVPIPGPTDEYGL